MGILVVSSMVHGHKGEWAVVIHRNPLDWPQAVRWWHIKQWNSIVYVVQGSVGTCSNTCCSITTSTGAAAVEKMMEMGLPWIIRAVRCWSWSWCWSWWSEIPSKREFSVGLRHSPWRETSLGFIIGNQGRWDAWRAYVKRKIRSSCWGRLNENPLQGHLLYGIAWCSQYIYIYISNIPFLFLY